jgi:hypothetical protein
MHAASLLRVIMSWNCNYNLLPSINQAINQSFFLSPGIQHAASVRDLPSTSLK